ncbi:MAG: MurR/RpiR family transcriptional regulator [Coprobacillaceae bacterium]
MMNIFSKLNHITDLTDNEEILVSYIKDQPEKFIKMSIDEICKASYVSKSTVYRLCHKLDISGLADFKIQIMASMQGYLKENKNVDYDYPVKNNETQYQIVNHLKGLYEQTTNATNNLIDLEQLRLIASAMKKAKYIDIYTSAGNVYFAENFKFQMQEIGVQVNVPIEEYLQRITASTSNKEHIAIIVSFGGRGKIMETVPQLLKDNKTPIILISSAEDNPLTKYATYQLYMSPHENHYNKISSFSTRLSLLYLLDCIYSCYFKLDYDENITNKITYYNQMTKYDE